MTYFKSMTGHAGPPAVFERYPEIYGPWSQMSQAMMNGPSPLSQGERELILAYAAGAAGCDFVHVAHSEVAYAWGIANGLVEQLLADPDTAPVSDKLRPLLAFVRTLAATPNAIGQADVDAVFAAGWDEHALQDAVAITARAAFMHRLVAAHGFTPMTREQAAKRALQRIEHGYVNLYAVFRGDGKPK